MMAEQLTAPIAYHLEGPVWSPSWGGLRMVDMLAGDVLRLQPDGGIDRRHVAGVAAAVRPRTGGGAVIGIDRGFALEEPDGTIRQLPETFDDDAIRMNEGGCDPDGRFYCGSMAYNQTPGAAALYRLDPDLSTGTVLTGVTVSNGLDWSPDGTRAYYNDTPTGQITVFDYDSDAGLTGGRTFVTIGDGGRPDGLTTDAEGGVWAAIVNRSAVHRYAPDGSLDVVVEVNASKVTACTFGGENLDELYITTSQENVDTGADPQAGSLFRAAVGVPGHPVLPFAG
jgi:sugar lactone lactonase YvrE